MKKTLILIFIISTSCAQNQVNEITLKTGRYKNLSLIINGDSVSGLFQYYKDWNEKMKDFESKNNFYFYGKKTNENIYYINITNPAEMENFGDKSLGYLIKRKDTLIFYQGSLDGMYQPVIFTNDNGRIQGYEAKITEEKKWIEIRFIKGPKIYLYDSPNGIRKKSYLLKYDVCWVLEKKDGWCKVEYYKFDSNILSANGWIKESLLYERNPNVW
ncbi:MAG: hypothetical protein Q8K92_12830 [Leadbetterella sp.]|nr:hypothetical protein [Leadbetterella sp.]